MEAPKEEEKVMTNKGDQRIQIHGKTAYQIALGEEDTEMEAMLKACIVKVADEKEAHAQLTNNAQKDGKKMKKKMGTSVYPVKYVNQAIRRKS